MSSTNSTNRPDKMIELPFTDPHLLQIFFGVHDQHLKMLETKLGLAIHARGNQLTLQGPPALVARGEQILAKLTAQLQAHPRLEAHELTRHVQLLTQDPKTDLHALTTNPVQVSGRRPQVSARTAGQKSYIDSIRTHDMVFGVGPAGTGKTYLAMALAVESLLRKKYERIILCRPAVEAGEKLGFLPGNMQEKVNPYLRPLYDALHDMLEVEQIQRLMEDGAIEVAPLAFMRGRTLSNSFVILDEGQNCTPEQMKMFLTRLGHDSKAVITGDITQIDLPEAVASGLVEAIRILRDVSEIHIHLLTEVDVVRHPLVRLIVQAYAERGGSGI